MYTRIPTTLLKKQKPVRVGALPHPVYCGSQHSLPPFFSSSCRSNHCPKLGIYRSLVAFSNPSLIRRSVFVFLDLHTHSIVLSTVIDNFFFNGSTSCSSDLYLFVEIFK